MAWTEPRGKFTKDAKGVTRARQWRGCYRDVEGKTKKTVTVDSKREALKLAQDAEARMRAGTWHDPSAGQLTFSTYFEEQWLPNRLREKNTTGTYRSNYNSSLRDAFGNMEVRKITTPVVQRWITRMVNEGRQPGTIAAHYKTLNTCLGGRTGVSAVRDGLIARNPCEGVELPVVPPREINSYSVDEVDRLMAVVDEWWVSLIMVAADSGARWGELMGTHVEDWDGRHLTIRRTILQMTIAQTGNGTPFELKDYPKNKKPRTFALSPEVAVLVDRMIKERHLFPKDRLFSMPDKNGVVRRTKAWPTGLPVSRSYFRQSVWLHAHEAIGLKLLHFHDLRGSHISWLLGGGADVITVMERVGHAQLSTTQLFRRSESCPVLRPHMLNRRRSSPGAPSITGTGAS